MRLIRKFLIYPGYNELYLLFEQLSAFQKSGQSITNTLTMIQQYTKNKVLKEELGIIRTNIEKGESLIDSFEDKRDVFPPFIKCMIRAGEKSGNLDVAFKEIAMFLKKMWSLRTKIVTSLLPLVFVGITFSLSIFIMANYVVPKMMEIYIQQKIELPWYTEVVFGGVMFINSYWWLLLIAIIGIVYLVDKFMRTQKEQVDYWLLKLPIVGNVSYFLLQYRFASTMSMLLKSGLDMVETLTYTASTINNVVFSKLIERVINKIVLAGEPLGTSLKFSDNDKILDFLLVNFITAGEETGNIETQLDNATIFYDEKFATELERFQQSLSVAIMIPMAILICLVYISILAPQAGLFEMNQ